MKRGIIAVILAVIVVALLMDVTWVLYEHYQNDDDDDNGDDKDIEEEHIPTPEEVNLSLNISTHHQTNYSNDFTVEGEPEGSNITWFLNDELLWYGDDLRHTFFDSGIYDLKARVMWSDYTVNISEELWIEQTYDIGSSYIKFPWYYYFEINPWYDFVTLIKPGLTEPTLWINTSFSVSNTLVKLWIELREEDKMESFEVVHYDVVPFGQMQYESSLFFDKEFFLNYQEFEPYYFLVKLELSDPDSAIMDGEVYHELRYG